jgi:hypothetical protein
VQRPKTQSEVFWIPRACHSFDGFDPNTEHRANTINPVCTAYRTVISKDYYRSFFQPTRIGSVDSRECKREYRGTREVHT